MMKRLLILSVLLIGCSEKNKPGYDRDFAESVITFSIETGRNQWIELPELYDRPAPNIPDPKDDQLILADKLITRGFHQTEIKQAHFPLLSRRIVTSTLVKDSCRCEVSKIYYNSSDVSQYIRTERIKCKNN